VRDHLRIHPYRVRDTWRVGAVSNYTHDQFRAAMSAIAEWDDGGGYSLRIGDADELARSILSRVLTTDKPHRDFTDTKELTLAIERSKNPIMAAVAVIGIAAGVLEFRSGAAAATRFLRAAADAIDENAVMREAQP